MPPRRRTATVSSPMAESPDRRLTREALDQVELWEVTSDSTVWIQVRDHVNGGWRHQRVGGRGAKRIQLTVEERRFNQDMIPDENIGLDPFSNGLLRCLQGDGDNTNAADEKDLVALVQLEDEDEFRRRVEAIDSEVLLRRVVTVAEKAASNPRYLYVKDVVDRRYRPAKSQPSLDPAFKGELLR